MLVAMLWCEDYWELIDQILDANPELHNQLSSHLKQHESRYSERLHGEKLARYLQRKRFKVASVIQSLLALGHASSGTDCLKLIKSMVKLRKKEDHQLWLADVKAGQCLERKATVKYVKMMGNCRPKPGGEFESQSSLLKCASTNCI